MKQHTKKIFFILIIFFAIGLRLYFAERSIHPGYSDDSAYLNVANNLYDGRGFVEDYIFFFGQNPPETITHPSNGNWMPLTSLILYGSMLLFGKSLFGALISSIHAGILISVFTYLFLREITENKFLQNIGFLIALFLPALFRESVLPSSRIFLTLFILISFYWLMIGFKKNNNFILLAAIPSALAYLTRNEGLLMIPVVILFGITYSKKTIWKNVILFILIYITLISPWLIRNYLSFGSLNIFNYEYLLSITSSEDFYKFSTNNTFKTFFEWGIQNIIISKFKSVVLFINLIFNEGFFIFPIIGFSGLFIMLRERSLKRGISVYLYYSIGLFVAYTLLFTFNAIGGSAGNSIVSILPLIIILFIIGLEKLFVSTFHQKVIVYITLLVCIFFSILNTKNTIFQNDQLEIKYSKIKNFLNMTEHNEKIVMTRFPIDFYYSTGFKSVNIPNDSKEKMIEVIKKYKCNYLITPAPRDFLDSLNSEFELKYEDPKSEIKLFKITIEENNVQNIKRK